MSFLVGLLFWLGLAVMGISAVWGIWSFITGPPISMNTLAICFLVMWALNTCKCKGGQ